MLNLRRLPHLALAVLAVLLPLGCGQRMAGTTSTAENTVSGVALLPNGSPAAGAAVSARSSEVVLSRNVVPESRLISFVQADAKGRFALAVPDNEGFYLEIRSSDSTDSATASWYREYAANSPVQLPLDRFTLDSSIEIRGTLAPAKGEWTTPAWVGIPGTDLFRVVAPGKGGTAAAFSLPGAPAGVRSLVVYLEPASPVQQNNKPVRVDSIAVTIPSTGRIRDVGEIRFQPF